MMKAGRLAALAASILFAGCGGGGGSSPSSGGVSISITPLQATIDTTQTQQYACAVTGSSETGCQWQVDEAGGGTISASGLYSPPDKSGTWHVTATAVADSKRKARATISVIKETPVGTTWVTGYYAGYYWENMYPPQEVDMSAMTHFVFARVAPGGGSLDGAPGTVVEGAGSAHMANHPFAPDSRPVENYLIDRAHEAGAKAILMLGGDGGDGVGFNLSTADAVRPGFVKKLVDYLVAHNYDGVDIDWENRLEDGCSKADCGVAINGQESLRRLKALIADVHAEANARPRYQQAPVLITFPGYAVSINDLAEQGGKVKAWQADVANMVDQYNLMSYGIGTTFSGGGWDSWFSGPLFGATGTRPYDLASSINAYVNSGVPRSRMGIGLGFYGVYYGHQIRQPRMSTDILDLAFEPGDQGTEYNMLKELGYLDAGTYVFDEEAKSAYRTYDAAQYPQGFIPSMAPHNQRDGAGYLSYENGESIAAKGQWVRETGVGGTIIWLINYGYLNGAGPGGTGGSNPLLAAVKCSFLARGCPVQGPF